MKHLLAFVCIILIAVTMSLVSAQTSICPPIKIEANQYGVKAGTVSLANINQLMGSFPGAYSVGGTSSKIQLSLCYPIPQYGYCKGLDPAGTSVVQFVEYDQASQTANCQAVFWLNPADMPRPDGTSYTILFNLLGATHVGINVSLWVKCLCNPYISSLQILGTTGNVEVTQDPYSSWKVSSTLQEVASPACCVIPN
jgi:hypothetical protein